MRSFETTMHQQTLLSAYGDGPGQYDRTVPLNNEPSALKIAEAGQLDPSKKVNINNFIKLQKGEPIVVKKENKSPLKSVDKSLVVVKSPGKSPMAAASILAGESLSVDASDGQIVMKTDVNVS